MLAPARDTTVATEGTAGDWSSGRLESRLAVYLTAIEGPAQGERWELQPGALTLGAAEACDLRIAGDAGVQPIHAALQVGEKAISIAARAGADLAVDGRATTGPVSLRPGALVRLGGSLLRLDLAAAAAPDDDGVALPPPDPPRWPLVLGVFAAVLAVVAVALIVRFVPKRTLDPSDRMAAEVMQRVKAATVWIVGDGVMEGSGFVVRRGRVITNAHVIEGARRVEVAFGAGTPQMQRRPARVLRAGTPGTPDDIALLACETGDAPTLELENESQLAEGTPVAAFGYPLGSVVSTSAYGPTISVRGGNVTAVRRGSRGEASWIEADIAAEMGNSGGPVVTLEGKVVGLATMIIGAHMKVTNSVPASRIAAYADG